MSLVEDSVRALWDRIANSAAEGARSDMADSLRGSPSAEEIAAVEAMVGRPLSPELVASYRLHDGQDSGGPSLLDQWQLLPLSDVLHAWSEQRDLLNSGEFAGRAVAAGVGVRQVWWDNGWLPLLANGAGDFCVVDLNPEDGGRVGQIISVCHESGVRVVVWSGMAALLTEVAEIWEFRSAFDKD